MKLSLFRRPILAAALGLLATLAQSRAQFVVDTGVPTANWYYYFVNNYQSFGGEIELSRNAHVTGLYGWMSDTKFPNDLGGTVDVSLVGNDPNTGSVLYSGSFALPTDSAPAWYGVSGLNLNLGPGNYFLEFVTPDAVAEMQSGAPNPLPNYIGSQLNGPWFNYAPLDTGIQVTGSVPDSAPTALLGAVGFLAIGAFRRRRLAAG